MKEGIDKHTPGGIRKYMSCKVVGPKYEQHENVPFAPLLRQVVSPSISFYHFIPSSSSNYLSSKTLLNPSLLRHLPMCQLLSRVQLFVTPWTVARQAPLSMKFPGQEYWSGQPFPSPGDLPNPGTEPGSPTCRQILYHLSHQGSPTDILSDPSTLAITTL